MVQGEDAPEYWMHLEVEAREPLETLDYFLRTIWLECCGHLSCFTIKGTRYSSNEEKPICAYEREEKKMSVKMGSVLAPGLRFFYEYDYGTTTALVLKVVSERAGKPSSDGAIQLLARNKPPQKVCSACGKPATKVCSDCIWEGEGWLCDECAQKHECGVEMLLSVVNSPRVGMCAYEGGYDDDA
jgi:hypothetical protein